MIDIINLATELVYWILLNFFILEIKTVRDVLQSRNHDEFEDNILITKILRYFYLPILALMTFIFSLLVALETLGVNEKTDVHAHDLEIIARIIAIVL